MAKLHLLSQKINLAQLIVELERMTNQADELLLIGESVLNLIDKDLIQLIIDSKLNCYGLAADCLCRGIQDLIPNEIKQISDSEMVDLIIKYDNVISW